MLKTVSNILVSLFRFTTNAADLTKLKTEVCSVQTLINCATWNPTTAFVVTFQGIMIDDGTVDLEGFVSTQYYNIFILVIES